MSDPPEDGWTCFAFGFKARPADSEASAPAGPGWIATAVQDQRRIFRLPRGMIAGQLIALIRHGRRNVGPRRRRGGWLRRRFAWLGLRFLHVALVLPLALEAGVRAAFNPRLYKTDPL